MVNKTCWADMTIVGLAFTRHLKLSKSRFGVIDLCESNKIINVLWCSGPFIEVDTMILDMFP